MYVNTLYVIKINLTQNIITIIEDQLFSLFLINVIE